MTATRIPIRGASRAGSAGVEAPDTPREREPHDLAFACLTGLLICLGFVIVLDASFVHAFKGKNSGYDPHYYFFRQLLWAFLAGVALMVSAHVPYWKLRHPRIWLLGAGIALCCLILVLIPGIGRAGMGARRWLGFGPVRFQPSEFAKVALVIFLARYSELARGRIRQLVPGFVVPVGVVCLLGGLIAIEDLGTAITVVGTGIVMLLMMGAQPRHLGGVIGGAAVLGVLAILVEGYRMKRIAAWVSLIFHPLAIHQGDAYQPWLGLVALGSGGVFGQGIMRGNTKHMYLPAGHTDYIFATVGEECGLLGTLAILTLFGCLIIRGLTIAHRTRDWFGSLLAAGLTCSIGIQTVLNVAVVTCLIPCTGVPLPFISYGGSSLLFTAVSAGLILSVSQFPGGAPKQARPAPEGNLGENTSDRGRNRRARVSRA